MASAGNMPSHWHEDFWIGISDSRFLRYRKEQETAALTVVSIDFELPERTDYDLLDSIVNHFRPKTMPVCVEESSWHEDGDDSGELQLLARDSLLNNLQTCTLEVNEALGFPPSSFILKEPRYPNYEVWCENCHVADGIDGFIESFDRDGCANEKLESTCISLDDFENDRSPAPKQLSKLTKTDEPLPKNEMTAWLFHEVHQVIQCEMHSFDNKKQWKRMEVHKWSVEYDLGYGRRTTHLAS